MTEYKIRTLTIAGASCEIIIRSVDNANIPPDPLNTDYIAYLAWVAAGNTPDPAEG